MALSRIAGSALVIIVVAGALVGCAGTPAPPAPTSAQLRVLISRAEGAGPTGYTDYDVSLVRFISTHDWPTVMTTCIRQRGITAVDFAQLSPGPYSYPNDPEGGAALTSALTACGLEYPVATMKPGLRTAAQWGYQYAYLVNDFIPCLRSAGAKIAPLPTRAAYLAQVEGSAAAPSPYSYIASRSAGVPTSLLESRCPATAPGL